MPLVRIEKSKGLFQENGKGFLAKPAATQALTNNAELDSSLGFHLPVTAIANQTGITLKDGSESGQLILISNIGDQNFDFNNNAFSTGVNDGAGDLSPTLPAKSSILCVWINSDTGWSLTSQSL